MNFHPGAGEGVEEQKLSIDQIVEFQFHQQDGVNHFIYGKLQQSQRSTLSDVLAGHHLERPFHGCAGIQQRDFARRARLRQPRQRSR